MSGQKNSSSVVNTIVLGAVGSLIASAVLACSFWLSATMVNNKPVAKLSTAYYRMGNLSAWQIAIRNSSSVAFEITMKLNVDKLKDYSLSQESAGPEFWEGELQRGDRLEMLLIVDNSEFAMSEDLIRSSISIRYNERDKNTGKIVSQRGQTISAAGLQPINALLRIFWFSLPLLGSGCLGWGVMRIWRIKNSAPRSAGDEHK